MQAPNMQLMRWNRAESRKGCAFTPFFFNLFSSYLSKILVEALSGCWLAVILERVKGGVI